MAVFPGNVTDTVPEATPRTAPVGARAARWLEIVGLLLPIVLMSVLVTRDLGALSFWRDEVSSVIFAHAPTSELLRIVDRDRPTADLPNMATYHLLLHYWIEFGESEARVRLLSALAGVATLVPVYLAARRLAGWQAGAAAAAFFSLVPFVIHHSREARGYSMAMLFAAGLIFLVLVAAERRRSVLPWLAYGVVAAVGLYIHFFVGLVIAAHMLWVLASRSLPSRRGLLAAGIPLAVAFAPIPVVIAKYGEGHEWIGPLTLASAYEAVEALAGGPALLLAEATLVAVAVATGRRDTRTWLLLGSAILPILAALAVSVVKPILVPRYLVVTLPALAVLVGCGLAQLRPVALRGASSLVLGFLLVMSLPLGFTDIHQQDWRAAARWMASRIDEEDRLVAANGRTSLEYYLGRAGVTPPPAMRSAAARTDPFVARVWLVEGGLPDEPDARRIRTVLSGPFRAVESREFGSKLRIVLLERSR